MAYFALRIPVVMAVVLLGFAGFSFLLNFFGYVLVLFHVPAILFGVLACGFMIFLTCAGVKRRKEQTKVSRIFAATLSGLVLVFVLLLDGTAIHMAAFIYVLLTITALVCSMILFFTYVKNLAVQIGLGIAYVFVMFLALFFLMMMVGGSYLSPARPGEVMQTVYSPRTGHRAEIMSHSQGAVGGSAGVWVVPSRSHALLFVGELQGRPRRIYSGGLSEYRRMSLRFETEDRLYVYHARDRIAFERISRNRWVRE